MRTSPILCLIYISNVFIKVENQESNIIYLLFIDDLAFLATVKSVIKIKKLLEKARKIILAWGTRNVVTYDIAKTDAILFFKAQKQKLVKQLTDTQLNFGGQNI